LKNNSTPTDYLNEIVMDSEPKKKSGHKVGMDIEWR
jgi:hypothetical protein